MQLNDEYCEIYSYFTVIFFVKYTKLPRQCVRSIPSQLSTKYTKKKSIITLSISTLADYRETPKPNVCLFVQHCVPKYYSLADDGNNNNNSNSDFSHIGTQLNNIL